MRVNLSFLSERNNKSVTTFRIFGILFNMVKPLLDERVRDNIVIHG